MGFHPSGAKDPHADTPDRLTFGKDLAYGRRATQVPRA
jgi:hypothetical protein